MQFFGIPVEIGTVSVLGIVGALSLLILGQMIIRGHDRHKRRIENFNKMATNFCDAFSAEISFLGSSIEEVDLIRVNAYEVLTSAIPKHEGAISVYKTILTERECVRLEKAWQDYLYPDGDPDSSPCPLVDYISDCQKRLEIEARHLALQKIRNILKVGHHK